MWSTYKSERREHFFSIDNSELPCDAVYLAPPCDTFKKRYPSKVSYFDLSGMGDSRCSECEQILSVRGY